MLRLSVTTMRTPRLMGGALGLICVGALLAAGCSSGGASNSIDPDLRARLASAGVTILDPGPTQDPAQVELGRALFFDKILSGNKDIACATCHHPSTHSSDDLSVSIGTGGTGLGATREKSNAPAFHARHSPDLFNRRSPEFTRMFWDNRANMDAQGHVQSPAGDALPPGFEHVLEVLPNFPPTARDEMRGFIGDIDALGQPNTLADLAEDDFEGIWAELTSRILAIPEYREMFTAAYPTIPQDDLIFQHSAKAIAAFIAEEFTFVNAPFDRYLRGDDTALTPTQKAGALLFFGAARCAQCHTGNLLTDQQPHNIAMPQVGDGKAPFGLEDPGLMVESGAPTDFGKFRTPPLRNVSLTAPYGHAGSYMTLEMAIRHHLDPINALQRFDKSALNDPMKERVLDDPAALQRIMDNLDPILTTPIVLSDAEFDALLDFVANGLTDPNAVDLSSITPAAVPSGLTLP